MAVCLSFCAASLYAIPAKKGVWRMVTLEDGTQVRVELQGDEYAHYWADTEGNGYNLDSSAGVYRKIDIKKTLLAGMEKREQANLRRSTRIKGMRKGTRGIGDQTNYEGQKKGVIILVEFKDVKFGMGHDKAYYNRVANEIGFTSSLGFKGSVKDYFLAQSNGKFELDFDVVGPYQLSHEMVYYGGNGSDGQDLRPGFMVAEACKAADADVNFADYDWDGDGEVDQVYVLYAGKGEAAGGEEDTVWPHEWNLTTAYGEKLVTEDNGMKIDTYACGSEMTIFQSPLGWRSRVDGIGTICHEFSHCLGYPDLYDTNYGGNYGMGSWDLMDQGSYNVNSFCPPNFSAYEKWFSGWIEPIVLDKPTTVKNMAPQGMHYGEAFVIYNDAHEDEYYLIENRQKDSDIWDSGIAGSGLMITHVDYNKDIWAFNNVNTNVNYSETYGDKWAYLDNDHERLTIFHADNETKKEEGDLYPYNGNNSLTDTSEPMAILYNGPATMGKSITNITQNEDGTINFDFMGGSEDNIIYGTTAIRDIKADVTPASGKTYTLDGKEAPKGYRGVVVKNGKKVMQ